MQHASSRSRSDRFAQPELLILDCDGVVIDSEVISAQTLIELLQMWDISIDGEFVREHFLGRSFPTVAGCVYDLFGVRLPAQFELDYRQRLFKKFETDLHLVTGLEDMLDRLTIPFCIATSSSPIRVARSLELTGVTDRFGKRVFTASQVARGKPAPDLFLHVAQQMGVAPAKCLVIEDSSVGLQAALSAQMRAVWFTGGSHMLKMRDADVNVVGFPKGPHYKVSTFSELFEHVPGIAHRSNGAQNGV